MQPIAQTQYSEQVRYNPAAEGILLPDELVLEIFSHLSTLERAKILPTCHSFNNLATDRALLTTEVKGCQEMISTFVEKNKTAVLSKRLDELNLDWKRPWQCLQTFEKVYQFDKLSIAQLAALTVPLENSSDPSAVGSIQRRYIKEVNKQVKDKEGCYRFEHGCMFTNDSFRIFLEAISNNQKIKKLVIQCDLTPDQLAILSDMLKTNTLKVSELYIKPDAKYSLVALQKFFDGIAGNQTLTSFEFYYQLANNELIVFNQALEQNHTLEKIGLNGGAFSAQTFQAFLGILAHKPNLKTLCFNSLLDDELVQDLYQHLPQTAIENLEFEHLRISNETGLLLAELIEHNYKLKNLIFPSWELSDLVAKRLLEVFKGHPHLNAIKIIIRD